MREETKRALAQSVREVSLPSYDSIPDRGLYLEQTTLYIAEQLLPLGIEPLTASMISNYVKKGIVANPQKKQYNREQIAHLLFIALAKSVMSLGNLQTFIQLQMRTYTISVAYSYFRAEFENVLHYTFGLKDRLDTVGVENTDEKTMLRNCIIAIANKIYLDKFIRAVAAEAREEALSQSAGV